LRFPPPFVLPKKKDFFQTPHGLSWLSRCEHLLSNLVSTEEKKEEGGKRASSQKSAYESAYGSSLLPLKWVSFCTCLVCAGGGRVARRAGAATAAGAARHGHPPSPALATGWAPVTGWNASAYRRYRRYRRPRTIVRP